MSRARRPRTSSGEAPVVSCAAFAFTTHIRYTRRVPLKQMVCRFCKWDTPYNVFLTDHHLTSCQEYHRTLTLERRGKDELAALAATVYHDGTAPSVEELGLRLLNQFDLIRTERFQRIQMMRKQISSRSYVLLATGTGQAPDS